MEIGFIVACIDLELDSVMMKEKRESTFFFNFFPGLQFLELLFSASHAVFWTMWMCLSDKQHVMEDEQEDLTIYKNL